MGDIIVTVLPQETINIYASGCSDSVNIDVGVPGPAGPSGSAGSDGLPGDFEDAVNPKRTHTKELSVAAGSSTTLYSDQIGSGLTGELMKLVVTSSTPFKAELKTVQNGVESDVLETLFGAADRNVDFRPPTKSFITVAQDAGAGFDGFAVTVTNLDTSAASNVYASFYYDEE